ncbi:hypothetical protein Oant_2322 [Brucella anthropi ATCC 49188]|uniref:Uncharacterized protein n=1 Tax=Brucella anthropi (strain ATCC 49188 / DSM 6882 / CCUG 24695 / JCM 21032 / LMG 3331 / NBRC 15819 / NCTC 12168 / Alc 37) TaxID=439375 RepID=A6X1D2_BRUA4|nr:hypothetical protein Oant_2322 [Brucella anthropi ATCC 49188]
MKAACLGFELVIILHGYASLPVTMGIGFSLGSKNRHDNARCGMARFALLRMGLRQ